MSLAERIAAWIREKVEEAQASGVVVGLSGGVDSSLVAVLAKHAMGDRMLALVMPCHSPPPDEEYARLVADRFGIPTQRIDLTPVYDRFSAQVPAGSELARANLKPRLRMLTLYYFANNLGYLVAGTGNKSELWAGYFTKYGDGGVDILPLGGLLKGQVRELAREVGIPETIIHRPPSAGLWAGQTDEGEMGLTYEELDRTIGALERGDPAPGPPALVTKVRSMYESTRHKRSPPPIFIP